ncbi:MAG: nucleoside deaminase [Alphaproteobacteria bacterium]|nr:nucleoside deaminase [Alphaproteobacteria bacterium]
MHEKFMARAMELARESVDTPGTLPYGAVVVKDGEIIGEGLNRADGTFDPISHGEVNAIRDACRRLSVTNLGGADMYTTGEPCSMCVAIMYQAGITRMFYAGAASDSAAFFGRLAAHNPKWARKMTNQELREQVGLPIDQRSMPAEQMMVEDIVEIFNAFVAKHT